MILKLMALVVLSISTYAQSQIIDIDERLTDLELKMIDRRLNVGMEMQMFAGSVQNENHLNSDATLRHTLFKNNLRLKINGTLNDYFKAYTSIQASYYFNDEVQTNKNYAILDTLSPEKGSTPYVRTAFFDWRLTEKFTLSAGRLPTTFGPPEHLKNGRSRLGTYPLASFNLPIDGVALTYSTMKNWDLTLTSRTIYIPGAISKSANPHEGEILNSTSPTKYASGHEGYTQMFEAEYQGPTRFFKKINFIAQYTSFKFGSFLEQTTPAQIIPNVEDQNIYRIYTEDKTLTKIEMLSLYLNLERVMNSNFDIYLSLLSSKNDPKAEIKAKVISEGSTTPGQAGKVFSLGKFITSKKQSGTRTNLGVIYNFKESLLGLEFYTTSGTPVPSDLYSDDFVRLGEIAGNIAHLFYTHMFYNRDLSIRTGAVMIDEKKNYGTFSFEDSKQNLQVFYTSLFVTF